MPSRSFDQLESTLVLVQQVLGRKLVGAYLHGSAVLGSLAPHSDLDIFVILRQRTTADERRQLVSGLLALSGGVHSKPPLRPIELTVVVHPDVRPWRYAPRMEFQFGEWLRPDLERGRLDLGAEANPDLAPLITMVLLGKRSLLGPPPHEVLDPVPHEDLIRAITGAVGDLLQDLADDTRNAVLTLARVWNTVATGVIRTKAAAAEWALPRLPAEHRPVLARARAIYLGEQDEAWGGLGDRARAYGEHVAARIADAEAEARRSHRRP